ncbi:MAG: glycosyltransferase family 2 protein [Nanoarchaeota archaeon]|nr:glycosyltransferase family 2 protein [Nanoarchaeota archaeon]
MKPSYAVSAFFPSYNEWGTISSMVAATSHILESMEIDHEIIVIDNGSNDYSDIIFPELKKRYPKLRVIRFDKNQGYGGALRAGFANSKNDVIFYTDADAQYDIKKLRQALESLDENTDMVTAYKTNRADELHRYILGTAYQYFVRLMFKIKTKDIDCDFRIIRKKVFDNIELESKTGVICVELIKKIETNGHKIKEIPIKHFSRAFGKSQFFNIKQVSLTLYSLYKLWTKLVLNKKKSTITSKL